MAIIKSRGVNTIMIDIKHLQQLAECWPVGSHDRIALTDALNFLVNADQSNQGLQTENMNYKHELEELTIKLLAALSLRAKAEGRVVYLESQCQLLAEDTAYKDSKIAALKKANRPLELHGPKHWNNQVEH